MKSFSIPIPVYRLAFGLCAIAVAYLAFAPLQAPPVFSWDKGNHVLAFFVMAWLADAGWPGTRYALPRWGLLLAYGLVIEIVQRELPMRHFSWLDFAADGLGISIYLIVRRLVAGARIGPIFSQE